MSSKEIELKPLDAMTLLTLPNPLKKTAIAILSCTGNEITAEDIAEKTGRQKTVERNYLNQLAAMGHLKKKRKGRKVYFHY